MHSNDEVKETNRGNKVDFRIWLSREADQWLEGTVALARGKQMVLTKSALVRHAVDCLIYYQKTGNKQYESIDHIYKG